MPFLFSPLILEAAMLPLSLWRQVWVLGSEWKGEAKACSLGEMEGKKQESHPEAGSSL